MDKPIFLHSIIKIKILYWCSLGIVYKAYFVGYLFSHIIALLVTFFFWDYRISDDKDKVIIYCPVGKRMDGGIGIGKSVCREKFIRYLYAFRCFF